MESIVSVNNDLVKNTVKLQQKKYRDLEKKFLLEGYKVVEEAVKSGLEIEYLFINSDKIQKYDLYNGRKILTNEAVLKKISDTNTPPEVVGVAVQREYSKNDFKNLKRVVLIENIKDVGNLGTIIRTSVAFGADGIILFGDCTDMYSPKCVRATVGNLWKIPILNVSDFRDIELLFSDFQRVATLPLAKSLLHEFKPQKKCLIMFGSEANGLSDKLINFSTESVKIEMKDNVESLNLAISTAVVLYELMRQD